ncbi:MAG: hypothetical protein R2762_20545 [Bryobacteraceae bacterium]
MNLALAMLRHFLREHPGEAARELECIDAGEAAAILADSPPEESVRILRSMAAVASTETLELMEAPSAVALLCRLHPALAAMLLRRMSLPSRENLLQACPAPWNDAIRDALRAPVFSAGALMEPRPLVFPDDWKAGAVTGLLARRPGLMAGDLFVVGRDHRLRGRLELRRVYEHQPARTLSGILLPDPPHLPIHATARFLHDDPLWRRFDVLPVVDRHGYFVGALSHRALRSLDPQGQGSAVEAPAGLVVEAAELAWTGCLAALDVAASLARGVSEPQGTKE